MDSEKITAFVSLAEKSARAGDLKSVVFHSPVGGERLKVRGRLVQIGKESALQLEVSLSEGRVTQENIPLGELSTRLPALFEEYRRADLNCENGSAALMISKKGAVSLVRNGKIGESAVAPTAGGNDREKNRMLTGEEKFLIELGISDESGRVHDKKQPKFRQICRFAEYISDAEKKLKRDGAIYVCDLCCGKSYLSFAAYHVLTELCGREVKMTCVDLKKSVMDYCAGVADRCGMDGMEFICANVHDFQPGRRVDMVISLHACDTATDMVLDFAVKNRADVILATPCCQHELYNEMDCPTLGFITRYSLLKQKLAATATDALRLLKLEAEGYKTDATELIDPEDTPKNIMLRGVRRKNFDPDSHEAEKKREEYSQAYAFMYGREP